TPLEPFGARHQIMARYTTDPPNTPPGQYVLLQYKTDVSGGRQVIETVILTFDGTRGWRVAGYYVRLVQWTAVIQYTLLQRRARLLLSYPPALRCTAWRAVAAEKPPVRRSQAGVTSTTA